MQRILNEAYAAARQTLISNRSLLDEISEYLLAKETITGDELMAYVNADKRQLPAPDEASSETE